MSIDVGHPLSPHSAWMNNGTIKKRGRSNQKPFPMLYEIPGEGMQRYYVTFDSVVVCISSLFSVARYAYGQARFYNKVSPATKGEEEPPASP